MQDLDPKQLKDPVQEISRAHIHQAADEEIHYDLITAADVFVYVAWHWSMARYGQVPSQRSRFWCVRSLFQCNIYSISFQQKYYPVSKFWFAPQHHGAMAPCPGDRFGANPSPGLAAPGATRAVGLLGGATTAVRELSPGGSNGKLQLVSSGC